MALRDSVGFMQRRITSTMSSKQQLERGAQFEDEPLLDVGRLMASLPGTWEPSATVARGFQRRTVVSFELGAFPAARPGLLVGVSGFVADLAARVALDLASMVDGARSRVAAIWRIERPWA